MPSEVNSAAKRPAEFRAQLRKRRQDFGVLNPHFESVLHAQFRPQQHISSLLARLTFPAQWS